MDYLERIKNLPSRKGVQPKMTPRNPQEQLEQFPEDWEIINQLFKFAFSLPNVVEMPSMVAPDGSSALVLTFTKQTLPDAFMAKTEFAHIHKAPTGSMHACIPQPYRNMALEKSWIIRHPFAIMGIGSVATCFIFAPRNQEELEWVKLLLTISYDWASGNI